MPPPPTDKPAPAVPGPVQPDAPDASGSRSGDEPTRAGNQVACAADGPPGPRIEGYALKEEIHRGGQGVVYRAVQLGTKRQVALKVLLEGPFAAESTRRRFEREVELAAGLRHPNIVTILDSGLSLGSYYCAMEYIDGVRLDRYLARKRPSLAETLQLLEKVCLAVNFAHQRGVIHRDLKPPNILVDDAGEPHVLDFGLAKPVRAISASDSTVQMLSTAGQILGTVAYMSPEQARGSQDVDVRTDVYSLGVIFYEALVGQPPYPIDGPLAEVLTRIALEEPLNPRLIATHTPLGHRIDDEVATILLKTLEKDPARRYQTAGDLARDLRHWLSGEPIEAKRASGLYMLKKTLRRYRLQAGIGAAILALLIGFLITFAVLFAAERDARRRAVEKTEETRLAVISQQSALREARERTAQAQAAERNLRRALAGQHIQKGDAALARSDYVEACDSYWTAAEIASGPAATWALRRYYLQTGDNGARRLAFAAGGPAALSPGGELAAVCPSTQMIELRDTQSGHLLSWVAAPGTVRHLSVDDEGALAAAGDGWAYAWPPRGPRAAVAAALAPEIQTHAVHVADRGAALVLVATSSVHVFRGPVGEAARSVALHGAPAGPSACDPRLRRIVVPTTAGVEQVLVPEDGAAPLTCELVWSDRAHPARAAQLDGGFGLAILADAVYVRPDDEQAPAPWERLVQAGPQWNLFDLDQTHATLVLASHEGDIAVYRGPDPEPAWRLTVKRLEQVRLSARDQSVITLDERGTLADWVNPQEREQRRLVYRGTPGASAAAPDGSVVLLAGDDGRVVACAAGAKARPRTILRRRLLDVGRTDTALAVSGDGGRAVIREGGALRCVDLAAGRTHGLSWNDPALPVLGELALSADGGLIALVARSQAGDQERVALLPWPARADPPGDTRPVAPLLVPIVGAVVRAIAFVPQTGRLLVVRSNGQLLMLDAAAREHTPQTAALEPWVQLEAPPTSVALSRTGEYLAAACEDDVLRLVSVPRAEVRQRVPTDGRVSALAFNPRDDVLMIRTVDGRVRLLDPAAGESIADWRLPADGARPLAAWIGETDAILLGQEGAVYEYAYGQADALIERSRPYAAQHRVARLLADGDFAGAWAEATPLGARDPQLGWSARLGVLESALRRASTTTPPDWAPAVLADAPPDTYLRLGHAAYDGELFDQARTWFHRGQALVADVDALTLHRAAECDYLAGAYDAAAAGLAVVLQQPDCEPAQRPTIVLERVAALTRAGRPAEARQAAATIGAADAFGRAGDVVAATSARMIARFITGAESENPLTTGLERLIGAFAERSLLFEDDAYFFVGEIARQRGDPAEAAVKYQRCIDVARDRWPASWARYRLAELSGAARPE